MKTPMDEPITMFKKQFNFLSMAVHPFPNSDWDFTCFKKFNNCYILLLNSSQPLENTGFVAGELSLIISLVLYRPISVYALW